MNRTIGIAALCGAVLVCGGCVNRENARLAIEHGLVLEGIEPGRLGRVEPVVRLSADENPIRPVAAPLDRSDWNRERIVTPAGGVYNRPTYTWQWIPDYSARAEGLSPTVVSALHMGDAGLEMGFAEGVASAAITVFDAVALVPRMLFVDPIWELNESPELAYQRQGTRPWLPLVVAPEAEIPVPPDAEDRVPGRLERVPAAAGTPVERPLSEDLEAPEDGEAGEAESGEPGSDDPGAGDPGAGESDGGDPPGGS